MVKAAQRNVAGAALIFGAALVAFYPALRGGLLWDDAAHITRPDLRTLDGLWRIWTDPAATQQYYPLLHTAFWLEHRLWGDAVLGYHLLNVVLHALSAFLVVLIVRRLRLPGAWLAGLLFALHPLSVESVAWIAEQKNTLSGALCLAAALAYLDYDESRRPSRYGLASALYILAVLAKTVTVMLPCALLAIVWWRRDRIQWRRDVSPLFSWLALGVAIGSYTVRVERTLIGAAGPEFALTAAQRVLLAGRALVFYAVNVVWPADLTFFYPRWTLDPAVWWQWLFPAGALAAAATLRRRRGAFAALAIFAVLLFPALGFFNVYPFRYSFVADHFAYLAALAILVPAAVLLSRLPLRAGFLVPAVLLVLTWHQAGIYRDEETLYRATLDRNPAAWLAHNNLGNLLLARGDRQEAIAHIEEAVRLQPGFWEAHLSLGNALLDSRLEDALAQYEIAVRLAPDSERTHTNLGNALLQVGRTEDAIAHLQTALRIDPHNAEAHNDLGNAWSRLPDHRTQAIEAYLAAIADNPNFAEPHNNVGRVYAQLGHWPDAVAQFQEAIRINPNSWSAHSNLGAALSEFPNRLPDAIAEYREALRLRPGSAAAHNNLGYALARLPGRLPEAIAEYREALRLDSTLEPARINLADALKK